MTSRSLLASELAERLRMRPELSASACCEEEEGGQAGRDRSNGSLVADLITVSRAFREKKNFLSLIQILPLKMSISDLRLLPPTELDPVTNIVVYSPSLIRQKSRRIQIQIRNLLHANSDPKLLFRIRNTASMI